MLEDLFISKNKTPARDIPLLQRLADENKSYADISVFEKRIILLYYNMNDSFYKNISINITEDVYNYIINYCKLIGENIVNECSKIIENHDYHGENIDLLLANIKFIKKNYSIFHINESQLQLICNELSYCNLLSLPMDYMSLYLKISMLNKIYIEIWKNKERTWYSLEQNFFEHCQKQYKELLEKYENKIQISTEEIQFIYCFTRLKPMKELNAVEKQLVKLTYDERDYYARSNKKLVTFAISNHIAGEDRFSDDVIGDGYEGLVRALNSYRKDLGYEFTTYAHKCIIRTIQYAKRKSNAKNRKNPKDCMTTILVSSIDETVSVNNVTGKVTKKELLEDLDALPIDEMIENKLIAKRIIEIVNEMLSHLSEMEEMVLRYRFGIGVKKKSQTELAKMFHTTQSYIHFLEKRGQEKIVEIYKKDSVKSSEIMDILK